jgi:rubrerythrin
MAAHSDSRPSTGAQRDSAQSADRTPSKGRASEPGTWNPYLSNPDLESTDAESRAAIPPPVAAPKPRENAEAKTAASVSDSQTTDLLDKLSSLTEKVKDGVSKEAIIDTVKKFAKSMQQTVAKLGGVSVPPESRTSLPPNDVATSRFSMPARNSLSNSLDGYRPDRDVVAPISVRPNAMELLWVCGDCGQHYPRARECPEQCTECGAPRQHFYAPIED